MNKSIDIICVGEVLIDFIGHKSGVLINETKDYHRFLGGSPSNVAINCSRLDLKSKLISSIGNDGFGDYILKKFNEGGVDCSAIEKLDDFSTSIIFVSRTDRSPDFIPYREADYLISEKQISTQDLKSAKIYHTTCFALSKEPARSTILNKAKEAYELGCKLSIDLNYADPIWNFKKEEAYEVIKTYCSYNPLIKVSEDDMQRLFGKSFTHDEIFDYFHKFGAQTVCLTLGSKGVKLSDSKEGRIELPAIKLEKVVDATGAGDAFWSGFLYAYIKEKSLKDCLSIALKLAALKLQNIGRLPNNINVLTQLLLDESAT